MTVRRTLAEIESHLKKIENLGPDKRSMIVGDLIRIRRQLDSLSECPPEKLGHLEDLKTRYKRQAEPIADWLAGQLQDFYDKQLTGYEDGRKSVDTSQLEQELKQARKMLEDIEELSPTRRSQPEIQTFHTSLDALGARLISAQHLKKLRDEVNDLWEGAKEVERDAPDFAIDYCKQALDKLNAALQSGGDWRRYEKNELLILRGNAQRLYDDIRIRHEVPITKQSAKEIVPLIIEFAERAKRNPSELVTYFASAELGADGQSMEVAEALRIAKELLIYSFWSGKINEYIQSADRKLQAHRPREAMAALRAWESLPGLYDDRVDVALPSDLALKIEGAEKRIKPGREALDKAERKANEARLETDPLKAHSLWLEARDAYAHLLDLEPLRKEIIEKARNEASRLLGETEEWLKKEAWELCKRRLERVGKLLELDTALSSEFQDLYERMQRIYEHVHPLTLRGKEQLKPQQECSLLEELRQEHKKSYWEDWSGLQERLAELQASSNVQAIQSEVDRLCKSGTTMEALESLFRRCEEMNESPPEGISAKDQKQLTHTIKKLKAWMGFARARDELDKVSDSSITDADTDIDLEWIVPPDLESARQGIRAARDDPDAAQAVKRYSRRLKQLERINPTAERNLKEAQDLLATQSMENFREALKQASYWLSKPTSHRAEFLELRREVQLALSQKIDEEVHSLISHAEKDWYRTLDTSTVEELLREFEALSSGHLLADFARGPLKAAKAHRREREAERGNADWDSVKTEWESAAEQVKEDALREYCLRRARQAYKQWEFIGARNTADPEESERTLRSLCEDPILRDNWDVWFQHGSHCLRSAQAILRAAQTDQLGTDSTTYLSWARESLNRASTIPGNEIARVKDMLVELNLWGKLADAQRLVQLALQSSGGRLTAANCREARAKFEEANSPLGTGEPAQLLEKFWNTQRSAARAALEAQAAQSRDVFERLDALLGISVLFPNDEMVKGQLAGLVIDALRQLREGSDDVAYDSTAERFLARYARVNKGGLPNDKDIVQLQLTETQQLIGKVQVLKTVLGILPGQFPDLSVSPESLERAESNLKDWERQLRDLQMAMDQAIRLAQDGLRQPEQFKIAKYILRQGGSGSVLHHQAPGTFKDKAHPSYRWCQERVSQQEKRRAEQEKLRRRIELCLKYEQVCKPDDLQTRDVRDSEERALVEELRRKLQRVRRIYPIQEALSMMKKMRKQEPNDACGLQETMSYVDPEDHKPYDSLDMIYEVIQKKVDQIHAVHRWLGQFTVGASATPGDCPGVVDWDVEKVRIERLRDSGPQGLSQARQECANVRLGDKDGLYQGLWSLTRTRAALSREAMLKQLKREMEGPDDGTDVVLCTVARSIDEEREITRQQFDAQIKESIDVEHDIESRIRRYESSWEKFVGAYHALMRLRKRWRKSKHWREFQQAAREFCGVCPDYDEFQDALNQVHRKTNMDSPCRKEISHPL